MVISTHSPAESPEGPATTVVLVEVLEERVVVSLVVVASVVLVEPVVAGEVVVVSVTSSSPFRARTNGTVTATAIITTASAAMAIHIPHRFPPPV
jgi:hypothetical protein